ncbi:hypothetical protein CQW23_23308 [Capsicum baccatum]|uniref:Retrotransposon gag domain-containing protein n=1 Tax=Capsicum baccatum TaxID=33114 RepID=A0A2G2VRL2_CAPBA|nr:hypothetical protein CQW23_23308 [Capsicum baccatum]
MNKKFQSQLQTKNFIGITDELEQSEGLVDLITQINALKEELALLRAQCDEQSMEFLNTREALMSLSHEGSSKFKIPKPKPFSGARSAKELENFLWDMDRYFSTVRVAETDKLKITMMYLTGDAKLWRQNIKDLLSAIAIADSLLDFRLTRSDYDILTSSKSKKKAENKGEGKKDGRNDKGDKGKAPTNAGNTKNKGKTIGLVVDRI